MNNYLNKIIQSKVKIVYCLVINGIMLHPDSAERQAEYVYKALLKYLGDQYAVAISRGAPKEEAHTEFGVFLHDAISMLGNWNSFANSILNFRREKIEYDFPDRLVKGTIAGQILHTAIENKISISASIDSLIEDNQQCKPIFGEFKLQLKGTDINFTKSNLTTNIWSQYKNVSHLWASFLHFQYPENSEILSGVFIDISALQSSNPHIQAEGFDGFMALSDEYLRLASSFTPPRSSKPILNKEDARQIFFPWDTDRCVTP